MKTEIFSSGLTYRPQASGENCQRERTFLQMLSPEWRFLKTPFSCTLRACLHGGGGPQVGEVTRLGEVKKNNPPLHAILQPRHPGVHFLKIIEWSLST